MQATTGVGWVSENDCPWMFQGFQETVPKISRDIFKPPVLVAQTAKTRPPHSVTGYNYTA